MSNTLCLYDDGEDAWPLKLHLGGGGVYLRGYANYDLDGTLACGNPSAVTCNLTNVTDYYARLDGDIDHLPQRRMTVVDIRCDISYLPHAPHTVDKLLCLQVFEHLTPVKAIETLVMWSALLKRGRPLVMSVPDMEGTLDLIEGNWRFALRHLRGRGGDDANTHQAWYTRKSLQEILEYAGFTVDWLPNVHFYPAIVVRAVKR